jgi:hypothetical protein
MDRETIADMQITKPPGTEARLHLRRLRTPHCDEVRLLIDQQATTIFLDSQLLLNVLLVSTSTISPSLYAHMMTTLGP